MKKVIIAIAVCTFALHAQGTGQVQATCACTEVTSQQTKFCVGKTTNLINKTKEELTVVIEGHAVVPNAKPQQTTISLQPEGSYTVTIFSAGYTVNSCEVSRKSTGQVIVKLSQQELLDKKFIDITEDLFANKQSSKQAQDQQKTTPQKSAYTIIAWYQDFSEKSTQDLNKAFGECTDKKSTKEPDKRALLAKAFATASDFMLQIAEEKDIWKVVPIEIRGEIDRTIGYPLFFEAQRIMESEKYTVEQLHQAMLPVLLSLPAHVRDLFAKYGLIATYYTSYFNPNDRTPALT